MKLTIKMFNMILLIWLFPLLALSQNDNYTQESKDNSPIAFDYYFDNNYKKVIEVVEDEQKNGEDISLELNILTQSYMFTGDFKKGLYYANIKLELQPSDYYAIFNKANCLYYMGEIDSAEFYYKDVLSIRPTYARVNLALANLYINKGDKQNAIDQYFAAIELFHKHDFKKEVIKYSNEILLIEPNNEKAKEYLNAY